MSVRSTQLAALVVSTALFSTAARAQDYYCSGVDCLPSTTTTLGTTTTTAGVIALIVVLVNGKDHKRSGSDGAKAAELYLRQNSLQLAQDLATGSGPVIEELSSALHISAQNKATFAELLRKDRKELLALADSRKLDTPRAVLFVKRMVNLMQSDAELSRDLGRLTAAN